MARYLIRNSSTGEIRIVGGGALPFFPGFTVLDQLDDGLPAFEYPTVGEADLRYVNLTEIGDPESPASVALRAASERVAARHRQEFSITEHGAIPATYVEDAEMTSGSAVLSSTSHNFTTSDVGKTVGVRGAGPIGEDYAILANDGVLVATIVSVSGGDATLSAPAVTSCTGAPCVFGWPADTAVAAAIAECTAAGGGTVYFPAGWWLVEADQPIGSRVSVAGAGRGDTHIFVTKVGTSVGAGAAWLRRASATGRYLEMNLHDFTVDGSFFASTEGYGFDLKMLHMSYTGDSTVERIRSINNPATAVGYDESTNCLIANNIIEAAGRLARPASVNGSPGGSAIGIAVGGLGQDLSMIVRDNLIKGLWTAAGGSGRAGINLEASGSTSAPETYYGGIQLLNNIIEGEFNGIVDSGSIGTIVKGNRIRRCNVGVKMGTNGIATGFIGRDALIEGNIIEDLVSGGGYTGAGVLISSTSSTRDTEGRTTVRGNLIRGGAGYGIQVAGTVQTLQHLAIEGNAVRDNGLSGIRLSGNLRDVDVVGNSISGNGKALAPTNQNAISVAGGTAWTDGRIEGNTFTDYAAVPTQNNAYVTTGATLTNVSIKNNTGDGAKFGYKAKTSTTTINNSATLATVSGFSLALNPGQTYDWSALIEYQSDAGVDLKIKWELPAGATLRWTATGPGAPDGRVYTVGDTAVLVGAGAAVPRAVRVSGFIVMGATEGTITLTAAQNVAAAVNTLVNTRTTMSARPI